MSKKTYTLELTAEELEATASGGLYTLTAVHRKLDSLKEQAKSDRERDDLRLPWMAVESNVADSWMVVRAVPAPHGGRVALRSARQVQLMAAAPELLEAVRALYEITKWHIPHIPADTLGTACELAERALRKVETGVPE